MEIMVTAKTYSGGVSVRTSVITDTADKHAEILQQASCDGVIVVEAVTENL